MSMITGLFLIWFICCMPFILLRIPAEISAILGTITAICVIAYLVCKPNNDSSNQTTTQRPVQTGGSSFGASDDDEIDDMIMMDMLDGDFDFFDHD